MTSATNQVHRERVPYFSVEKGFNIKRQDLEPWFLGELERVLDPATPASFVPLDQRRGAR